MTCLGRLLAPLLRQYSRVIFGLRATRSRSAPLTESPISREAAALVAGLLDQTEFVAFVSGAAERTFSQPRSIRIKKPKAYAMESQQQGLNCSDNRVRGIAQTCLAAAQGTGCGAAQQTGQSTSQVGTSLGGELTPDRARSVRLSVDVPANNRFDAVLMHCRNGGRASRAGWNGAGQYVFAQWPDKHSKMGEPYFVLMNTQRTMVPWAPSQGDLFACDWALHPVSSQDC